MRKIICTLTAVILLLVMASMALSGDVRVRGHWRDSNRDGVPDTWVQPHNRTAPDPYRQLLGR